MSDCNENTKDCDECQKTLKDHLKKCADYGQLPSLLEKCDQLPGGCSNELPATCPAPPPECPPMPVCPPKCNTPDVTFTCPASSCQQKEECLPKPKSCPPPPTKVEQCPPKAISQPPKTGSAEQCPPKPSCQPPKTGSTNSSCGGGNDNSCDPRPLSMDK